MTTTNPDEPVLNTFRVTYATGLVSTWNSTCASIEDFCNDHFGSAWNDAEANGASVVMNPVDSEVPVDSETLVVPKTSRRARG